MCQGATNGKKRSAKRARSSSLLVFWAFLSHFFFRVLLNPLFGEPVVCAPDSRGFPHFPSCLSCLCRFRRFRDFRHFRERATRRQTMGWQTIGLGMLDLSDFQSFCRSSFCGRLNCLVSPGTVGQNTPTKQGQSLA